MVGTIEVEESLEGKVQINLRDEDVIVWSKLQNMTG